MNTDDATTPTPSTIDTGGGAVVQGNIDTGGGAFIGRDQIVHGDVVEGDKIQGDKVLGDKNVFNYPRQLRAPLREQFDPLIENRTQLFGGRDAILKQIEQTVQTPGGGYMVITAPAGFGKTALMAVLVSRNPRSVAYHFFTRLYASALTETFFLRNVVEQLAGWHGSTDLIPEQLDELRALYHQLLDRPLDRPRTLVLDGLDEVITWDLAPYLRRPPTDLHIIMTIRDVGQDWSKQYQLSIRDGEHIRLDGLNREDVAQALRAAGLLATAFAGDPKLLDEVVRVSAYELDQSIGADPFYVRLLAEDIASGALTAQTIANKPHGLDDYLDRWWQELKALVGEEPLRDLFGTLTAAIGPIYRADLEAINPQSLVDDFIADRFDDVLAKARRLVTGDEVRGYALVHPRLLLYMRSRIKIAAYQDKLLTFCAGWKQHRSPYALTDFAQHLAVAGRQRDMYDLVLNQTFRDTQLDGLGDAGVTLGNLLMALRSALASDDMIAALACVGIYRMTTRSSIIVESVFDAVDKYDFKGADKRAEPYSVASDWTTALQFYIGWHAAQAARTGMPDAAQSAVEIIRNASAKHVGKLYAGLCDALLVGTSRALADAPGSSRDTRAWLAELGRGDDADALLQRYAEAQPLGPDDLQSTIEQCDSMLRYLGIKVAKNPAPGEALPGEPGHSEAPAEAFLAEVMYAEPLTESPAENSTFSAEQTLAGHVGTGGGGYVGTGGGGYDEPSTESPFVYPFSTGEEGAGSGGAGSGGAAEPSQATPLPAEGTATDDTKSADDNITKERLGVYAEDLRGLLAKLAYHPEGQERIDKALQITLTNPYPRYRDITLVAVVTAALAVPDTSWKRQRLQWALAGGLNREGVSFTFDLPFVLLFHALQHNLPAPELNSYYAQVFQSRDRWGTLARAHSARAAAVFRQHGGLLPAVENDLQTASTHISGFSGLACVTTLSLVNRCYEFGGPQAMSSPLRGANLVAELIRLAEDLARKVRDPEFRQERIKLAEAYAGWFGKPAPETAEALATLAAERDREQRLAMIDYLSAHWSWPANQPNWEGLKALVPLALVDGTTLDGVLARLYGLYLHRCSAGEIATIIDTCAKHLTTGRPWELGNWR